MAPLCTTQDGSATAVPQQPTPPSLEANTTLVGTPMQSQFALTLLGEEGQQMSSKILKIPVEMSSPE